MPLAPSSPTKIRRFDARHPEIETLDAEIPEQALGMCPAGVNCRFASGHIADGKNVDKEGLFLFGAGGSV